MQQLQNLLDLAVAEVSFDAGSIEMPREGISISYASRPHDIVTPEQWAGMIEAKGWESEEFHRASRAHLVIPDELFSDLENLVRCVLKDLIDPETDRIGHAFPTGGSEESYYGSTSVGALGWTRNIHSWSSPVVNLVDALIKSAVALGPGETSDKLQRWMDGDDPVSYREATLLNGVAFTEADFPIHRSAY